MSGKKSIPKTTSRIKIAVSRVQEVCFFRPHAFDPECGIGNRYGNKIRDIKAAY